MVASRSDAAASGYDRFHCLQCDTVITFDHASGDDLVQRHPDKSGA
jgi:hypothetical protein